MKLSLSTGVKHMLMSIATGLLWVLAGLCVQKNTVISSKLGLIFLILALAIQFIFTIATVKPGIYDERLELNILKAKSRSYNSILAGIGFYCIVINVQTIIGNELMKFERSWAIAFIGTIQIIEGFHFFLNEKRN